MERLETGPRLFYHQFKALMYKNLVVSLRNKRAFFLQLGSSFWFIFLLFGVDQATIASRKSDSYYREVTHPKPVPVGAIPDCGASNFIVSPCFDFVWSDDSKPSFRTIVSKIMANNPGRPIPPSKVRGFSSTREVDSWLLANPRSCGGALHLEETSPGVIAYGLQFNSTPSGVLLRGKHENAPFSFQVPMQVAAEREITRFVTGRDDLEWNVSFSEFAHPELGRFSSVGTVGPTFLFAATMFSVVILISRIVYEKELKLRQVMATMGLYDSVYWLSWLAWETLLALCSSIILVVFGMIFQLNFFVNNSFGILLLIFFLFQFNMIGFAFLVSTFLSRTETANSWGFCIFIFGSLTQLVTTMGFPYDRRYPSYIGTLWSTFPPNVFAIGLFYLGEATATKKDGGLGWKDISSCPSYHEDCTIVIAGIFSWLIGTFFVWFFLAIYFDNVLKDSNGQRKSCIYFTKASYWTGNSTLHQQGANDRPDDSPEWRPKDPNVAVQLRGLWKTFPGVRRGIWRRGPPYHAVQGVWLDIEKDQIFCLLGHNGAGKTTIINILTGIFPLTAGDALIHGTSVKSSMSNIRHKIGVCPQFNILWDSLTGSEHLHLFASIKGLPPSRISLECRKLLGNSSLLDSAKQRVSSYCEGMKRRLSVAIALIGDPKVVFLDEPTTGMDPITRKQVWDVIDKSKMGRAVVLTTHSMEEADNLGDLIAIMAAGKLRCVGTSIQLKQLYGQGYSLTCGVQEREGQDLGRCESVDKTAVKDFFKLYLDVEPKEETKSYITFLLPRKDDEQLAKFFQLLQSRQQDLHVSAIQLSLATLEEEIRELDQSGPGTSNSFVADLMVFTSQPLCATVSWPAEYQIRLFSWSCVP